MMRGKSCLSCIVNNFRVDNSKENLCFFGMIAFYIRIYNYLFHLNDFENMVLLVKKISLRETICITRHKTTITIM